MGHRTAVITIIIKGYARWLVLLHFMSDRTAVIRGRPENFLPRLGLHATKTARVFLFPLERSWFALRYLSNSFYKHSCVRSSHIHSVSSDVFLSGSLRATPKNAFMRFLFFT